MARTATTISWAGCGHGCGCIDITHSILRPGRGSRPQHDPSILRLEKINGREQGRAISACRRISQHGHALPQTPDRRSRLAGHAGRRPSPRPTPTTSELTYRGAHGWQVSRTRGGDLAVAVTGWLGRGELAVLHACQSGLGRELGAILGVLVVVPQG